MEINSVFGKTMENVENRIDVRLITHFEKFGEKGGAECLICKPNFKDVTNFSENLVALEISKTFIVYDKPMFVGFAVLDLSKTVIYEFFYNSIKQKYQNNVSPIQISLL